MKRGDQRVLQNVAALARQPLKSPVWLVFMRAGGPDTGYGISKRERGPDGPLKLNVRVQEDGFKVVVIRPTLISAETSPRPPRHPHVLSLEDVCFLPHDMQIKSLAKQNS